ncbi:MAG: tyrosine-type recombinase/integrase [Sporichthyaceae bacterium]
MSQPTLPPPVAVTTGAGVFNVQVFALTKRAGSSKPWQVRWRLTHRGRRVDGSEQFPSKALAEDFRARLITARNAGEPFDPHTKLPASWGRAQAVTSIEFLIEHAHRRWPQVSPNHRRGLLDGWLIAALTLLWPHAALTDAHHQQARRLIGAALVPTPLGTGADFTHPEASGHADQRVWDWLLSHSLPVADLDLAAVEKVLDAFAARADGKPGHLAASSIRRRRTALNTALTDAVKRGLLTANPLLASDWKVPKINHAVDLRLLLDVEDFEALHATLRAGTPAAARLAGFYAVMFYAGLRTAETTALTVHDLHLPEEGWGHIDIRRSLVNPGARYTDDGAAQEGRGVKGRAHGAARRVPIPPRLVALLTDHIRDYPVGSGLVFTNTSGGLVHPSAVSKILGKAKRATFPPGHPLQGVRPYDCRHSNASLMLKWNVSPMEAARRLGHSPEVLWKVYAGVMATDEEVGNQRLDQLWATERP